MLRIQLRFVRSHMHLAEAVSGPDGALVAGAGTRLTPAVVGELDRLGLSGVAVREVDEVADWENGFGGDRCVPPIAPVAWRLLGLGARDLDAMLATFEEDLLRAQDAVSAA